jgi:hypothetical protein
VSLTTEDGSGFQNFTRMKASEFESLANITGSEVSIQGSCYRKSLTVDEITVDSFALLGLLIP